MSFIPDGTSRLYLEEVSEPDHFRCTQANTQHECSCHISPPCSACVDCPVWDEEDEWPLTNQRLEGGPPATIAKELKK